MKDSGSTAPDDRVAEFLDLYTRHHSRLRYYLMALLPTSNDADDVLQESSLVLWQKFETYQSNSNFYAWACKIARLQALKHYERIKRSAKLLDTKSNGEVGGRSDGTIVLSSVPLEALESCLDELPNADQILIRRRYEPESSVKRIALEIGRTANSLSKSLGRIRRTLLECIERKLPQEW